MLRTLLLLTALTVAYPAARPADKPTTPLLLELFGSEGCSSCPPADTLLAELVKTQPVAGAQLVLVAEHVDYWDHLGWRDPFGSPGFTAQQRKLVGAIQGNGALYTPMLVVDGAALCVASDSQAVLGLLQAAAAKPHARLTAAAQRGTSGVGLGVTVHDLPPGFGGRLLALEATVLQPSVVSHVTAGENAGRTLTHVMVAGLTTRTVVDARKLPFSASLGPIAAALGAHVAIALRLLDGTQVLGTTELTAP